MQDYDNGEDLVVVELEVENEVDLSHVDSDLKQQK